MTKADLRRFQALQDLGCICCHILGFYSPPDIHHLLSGGRRQGHRHTIPLCPWHHRGVLKPHVDMGPSLANGSKPFVEHWGTEQQLLAIVDGALGATVGKRL